MPDLPQGSLKKIEIDLLLADLTLEFGDPALRLARLGPIRSVDYAGLETALHALQYIYEKTGDTTFQPPAILKEKVAKGELGLKTAKGFYVYSPEEATKLSALANEAVMQAIRSAG